MTANDPTTTPAIVTFGKLDKNEWYVEVNGEDVGTLNRDRPARFAAGARHGMVEDRTAAYQWTFVAYMDVTAPSIRIPDGISIRGAKAAVTDALSN